jgi:hypothetical protein
MSVERPKYINLFTYPRSGGHLFCGLIADLFWGTKILGMNPWRFTMGTGYIPSLFNLEESCPVTEPIPGVGERFWDKKYKNKPFIEIYWSHGNWTQSQHSMLDHPEKEKLVNFNKFFFNGKGAPVPILDGQIFLIRNPIDCIYSHLTRHKMKDREVSILDEIERYNNFIGIIEEKDTVFYYEDMIDNGVDFMNSFHGYLSKKYGYKREYTIDERNGNRVKGETPITSEQIKKISDKLLLLQNQNEYPLPGMLSNGKQYFKKKEEYKDLHFLIKHKLKSKENNNFTSKYLKRYEL